jgi:hypothetical protein
MPSNAKRGGTASDSDRGREEYHAIAWFDDSHLNSPDSQRDVVRAPRSGADTASTAVVHSNVTTNTFAIGLDSTERRHAWSWHPPYVRSGRRGLQID